MHEPRLDKGKGRRQGELACQCLRPPAAPPLQPCPPARPQVCGTHTAGVVSCAHTHVHALKCPPSTCRHVHTRAHTGTHTRASTRTSCRACSSSGMSTMLAVRVARSRNTAASPAATLALRSSLCCLRALPPVDCPPAPPRPPCRALALAPTLDIWRRSCSGQSVCTRARVHACWEARSGGGCVACVSMRRALKSGMRHAHAQCTRLWQSAMEGVRRPTPPSAGRRGGGAKPRAD